MLKIFTSKSWLFNDSKHVVMLSPWWGGESLATTDPDFGRFLDYEMHGNKIFEFCKMIEDADIVIYPQELNVSADGIVHVKQIAGIAKSANKKMLVFYNSDDDREYNLENILLYRTSFYKSKQRSYEFSLPGWSKDFINYCPDKNLETISNYEKPSVSYCGYIDYVKQTILKKTIARIRNTPKTNEELAKSIRGKACRVLKRNSLINSNFIIRSGFWAFGINDKIAAREEYAQNLFSSLYAIATRGGGNFSYRLYEILSCGRIPIFINTDAVLPFDSHIEWKEHVVWVEQSEIDKIDKILLAFHKSKSRNELELIQAKNRMLYEQWISPVGFHKELSCHLKKLCP